MGGRGLAQTEKTLDCRIGIQGGDGWIISRLDRPKTKPERRQVFEFRESSQRCRLGANPYWNALPKIVSLGHLITPVDPTVLIYNLGLFSER